jgi:DNA-binding NtrC family response regulator
MKSNAHVLIVGKDETLLQTRRLILGTFFHVETAGRVSHAAGILTEQSFDLIVLCYSLTDDECQKVLEMVAYQDPQPQVLSMSTFGRPAAALGIHEELSAEDGPYALVKKCAQMLDVDLKGLGRAASRGFRRTPALRT